LFTKAWTEASNHDDESIRQLSLHAPRIPPRVWTEQSSLFRGIPPHKHAVPATGWAILSLYQPVHWSATRYGKAVSIKVDHINITRRTCNSFFQTLESVINQGKQDTIHYFCSLLCVAWYRLVGLVGLVGLDASFTVALCVKTTKDTPACRRRRVPQLLIHIRARFSAFYSLLLLSSASTPSTSSSVRIKELSKSCFLVSEGSLFSCCLFLHCSP
jgi:hypothetical protein